MVLLRGANKATLDVKLLSKAYIVTVSVLHCTMKYNHDNRSNINFHPISRAVGAGLANQAIA